MSTSCEGIDCARATHTTTTRVLRRTRPGERRAAHLSNVLLQVGGLHSAVLRIGLLVVPDQRALLVLDPAAVGVLRVHSGRATDKAKSVSHQQAAMRSRERT